MVITTSTRAPESDNDSISLTSTIISAHSEDELFEVQRILAENPENKKKTYLIQWVGYPISRATWEPRKQIQHLRHIISEWRERQKQQSSGVEEVFNTSAWAAARVESENERQSRKIRRATKRKRLQRAAKQDFDLELLSRSRTNKKRSLEYHTTVEADTENLIINESDLGENFHNKTDLISKQKNLRAKRKVISDDDDEINSNTEQSSIALNLKILDNPCMSLFEARSLYSPVSTTQKNLSAQSSPASTKRSQSTQAGRPSSSSDESLSQIIRRSKVKKTACLAANKTPIRSIEESNAPILGHISSSSSSDNAPLAKRLLLPYQRPRITSVSNISGSSPSIRKDRYSSRSRNSSSSPSRLFVPTKRTLRHRSRKKISLPPKPIVDSQKEQELPLDLTLIISANENQTKNPGEVSSIFGEMGSVTDPSKSSLCEQMDTKPSEKDPKIQAKSVESCSYTDIPDPASNPTNEKIEGPKQPRSSYEIHNRHIEFSQEPLNYCLSNQPLNRSDSKKLGKNELNINSMGYECDSLFPISNALEVECQIPLSSSHSGNNKNEENQNEENKNEENQNQKAIYESSQVPLTGGTIESLENTDTLTNYFSPNSRSNTEKSEPKPFNTALVAYSNMEASDHLQEKENNGTQTINSTIYKSLGTNSMNSSVQRDIEMRICHPESPALLHSTSLPQIINPVTQNSLESNNCAAKPSHGKISKASVRGQFFRHKSEDFSLPLESSRQSEWNDIPASDNGHHNLTSEPSLPPKLHYETQPVNNQSTVDSYDAEMRNCETDAEEIFHQSRTCQSYNPSNFKAQVTTSPKNWGGKKKKIWTKKICKYWLANNCSFGTLCKNIHDTSSSTSTGNIGKPQALTEREKSVNFFPFKNSLQTKQTSLEYDASSEDRTKPTSDSVPKLSNETLAQPSLPSIIPNGIEHLSYNDRNEGSCNFLLALHSPPESIDHQVPRDSDLQTELAPIVDTISVAATDSHQLSTCSDEHKDSDQDNDTAATCVKEVFIGSDSSSSISLKFDNIKTVTNNSWKERLMSIEKVHFNKSCIAQDFQGQYFMSRFAEVWQGNIFTVSPNDQDATKAIDMIFNELVIRCAGLIATVGKFYILIFPVRREEWRFLDRSPDSSSDLRLRYSIISNNYFNKHQDLSSSCARILFHQQLYLQRSQKILIMNLLEHFLPGVGNCSPECRFYLLFPPAASEIADLVKFCLISHNPNFKLYGSLTEGSWDMFTQAQFPIQPNSPNKEAFDRIVLIHEVSATEICRIPKLSTILNNTDMMFWQVSDGTLNFPPYPSRYFLPNAKLGQISATRLFPHGCAILLTPSFLVAEPRAALDFIRWIEMERFQVQFPLWRLIGAYNLPSYVLDVAKSKASEASSYERRHSKDPRRNSVMKERSLDYFTCNIRWGLYAELAKLSQFGVDELDSIEDIENCLIQAPSFINPDNEHELIRWFAAWSAINCDMYRKFIVIGTDSSNVSQARYLKEVPKKNRDVNIIATRITQSQNSAYSAEMRPLQKSRLTEKSSPPSKAQTQDTLISEISYRKVSESPDRNFHRTAIVNRNVSECVDPNYGRSKNVSDVHEAHFKENSEGAPRNSSKLCHIQSTCSQNCNKIEKNDEHEIKALYEGDLVNRALATSESREGCSVIQFSALELKEQQFEATTDWYQRLKARGGGWEHITVTEHLEAWQILEYNRTQ